VRGGARARLIAGDAVQRPAAGTGSQNPGRGDGCGHVGLLRVDGEPHVSRGSMRILSTRCACNQRIESAYSRPQLLTHPMSIRRLTALLGRPGHPAVDSAVPPTALCVRSTCGGPAVLGVRPRGSGTRQARRSDHHGREEHHKHSPAGSRDQRPEYFEDREAFPRIPYALVVRAFLREWRGVRKPPFYGGAWRPSSVASRGLVHVPPGRVRGALDNQAAYVVGAYFA
jgi:hypothetical protein